MTLMLITIGLYDLTGALPGDLTDRVAVERAWDEAHVVSTLQGLVNRDAPRLYLRYVSWDGRNVDDFWLARLRAPNAWLGDAEFEQIDTLEALVARYRDHFRGVVLYDPHRAPTSNVASTIAGAADLVAVRYDPAPGSVYSRLVTGGPQLPVRVDLRDPDGGVDYNPDAGPAPALPPDTRSAKTMPYEWARLRYLDAGRCDPRYIGYYIDSYWIGVADRGPANQHTLTNHDYFVAKRAFFCDLNCWDDERSVDDPQQPPGADRQMLRRILRSAHEQSAGAIIHIGGFTPWAYKYTDVPGAGGRRGGVATEWELVKLVSAFNGFIDADALGHGAMANASFFMHFPLQERYEQKRPPVTAIIRDQDIQLEPDTDYVTIYVGDYDSAAWLYQRMPDLWFDAKRGQVPMSWAISPVLSRRAPHILHLLWTEASERDYFIAGDNGAGYLNPSMLVEPRPISNLPSGLDAWTQHNAAYYRQWDLSITGFIIDGNAPPADDRVLAAYQTFSPAGVVSHQRQDQMFLHHGLPVFRHGEDIGGPDPVAAGARMAHFVEQERSAGQRFHRFRSILQSPSWHQAAIEELQRRDPKVKVVNADVFFYLLKQHLQE